MVIITLGIGLGSITLVVSLIATLICLLVKRPIWKKWGAGSIASLGLIFLCVSWESKLGIAPASVEAPVIEIVSITGNESPTIIPTSKEVTVDERVLFEQSGVKLTVTGLKNSFFGPELTVLVENDGSVPVTVQTRDVSVNGYMMSSVMFSADVVVGKKNNDTITFMSSELKESGIETLATIELSFHVFNSDSWGTVFDTDAITIETSAAGSVEQAASKTKRVAFEQNGIKIAFVDFDSETFFGTDIKFYIENNSDTPITVQVRDTSINGFMIDGSMSCDVLPGKMANTRLSFFSSSFKENGITDIESVELKFHIYNKNSWNTIIETDVITLKGSE